MYFRTQRQSPLGGMQSSRAKPVGGVFGPWKGGEEFLFQTNSLGRKISLIKVTKLIAFEMMY